MSIKFVHANIVSKDLRALSKFYQDVFECVSACQPKEMSGDWVDRGTGVQNAKIKCVHLRLPGYDQDGPTLEIFEYDLVEDKQVPIANRLGFGHIAFLVDDVEATRRRILHSGGSDMGQLTEHEIPGTGKLTFVYMKDPEGNIIEIQKRDKMK